MNEQKKLDRPDREKFLIDLRLLEEHKTSPEWIATKYLALIPDIEELQRWYDKLLAEFKTLKRERSAKIEEAKKQAYEDGLDDATHDAYNAGLEAGEKQERERIIEVIIDLNSIGYAYGAEYKVAILEALKRENG